jgi:hypothetical protein
MKSAQTLVLCSNMYLNWELPLIPFYGLAENVTKVKYV